MSLTKATFSMIDGGAINVRDFGADPTGVADSSAAIQAATFYWTGTKAIEISRVAADVAN